MKNYLIIGLSGFTNSGKTTVAEMLCSKIPKLKVINQDNYFLELDDPAIERDSEGAPNWEKLSALDMKRMVKDVEFWIENETFCTESIHILLVEGFLLYNHKELNHLIDYKYFIKIEKEKCYERRLQRVYTPPDPVGYFEKVVWPMTIQNLFDLQSYKDIEVLDMPKKFKGENSKATEAKARKDAVKQAENERILKQEEDELWKDDDKHIVRKQQRKEEKEKKRHEQIERKKTLQQLHEEEMSSIKGAKSQAAKLTRAQILENQERAEAAAAQAAKAKLLTHAEVPLEENVNKLEVDGDEARTIDEAITVLSVSADQVDRHPEKRMRAAYTEYEESHLPALKQENPNLRLSQLKQMIKKDWMKAPENPLNQKLLAYNAKI